MNTILQLHSKVVTSVILITSIVGLLISIYDPLPEYYGTAVSVAIWVFSLWVLKRIRNFYIAGKETTTIEKNSTLSLSLCAFRLLLTLHPKLAVIRLMELLQGVLAFSWFGASNCSIFNSMILKAIHLSNVKCLYESLM